MLTTKSSASPVCLSRDFLKTLQIRKFDVLFSESLVSLSPVCRGRVSLIDDQVARLN